MNSQKLLEYFTDRREEIVNSIIELVEIESPSYDIAGSRNVADFLENEARKISDKFQIERIFAENYGEHFILRTRSEIPNPKSQILLLGHTDTVHPSGTKAQNPTRIEDGKLYGCGTFDMKANVVLMFEILRFFAEFDLKPTRPIAILLSCDEEVGSFTGRKIVEREALKSKCCLVLEPSLNGKVKTGRKGTGMFTLKAHGIPAHAGLEPEKGASAILELSRQIEKLHTLNNLQIGTTVNVCTISGGTTTNVIPAEAECTIDVRFTSMAEATRIENEIGNLKSFDEKVSLELLGAINRPPLERNENVIDLYEKMRKIALGFDYELGEAQVGGASDGNFVGVLGVPVLDGLGISGAGAHTLEEFVFVEDIPKRAALIAAFLLDESEQPA